MSTEASSSSASAANTRSEVARPAADEDIEKLLSREASAFQREIEVERILKAFKLNPYDILDVNETATTEEIKRRYRQLSLFIHPDKTPHVRAPDAFDILKKAESDLSDAKVREELDAVIKQARLLVLKSHGLPSATTDDDPKLKDLQPPFKVQLREKSKDLLIEEEVRRRKAIKMNLANEGLEARKKEEEVISKKRKVEEEKAWEDGREQRVGSWRNFSNAKKKKKTKGPALLG
ncbi:DnaJ-domain-containing protein [Gloeophyllum trabeum ATCC 11539]|uniref:DnaJ-domain-containing protein n=1 Tax=Gloeophyllum trabeum (strain ATCC 11539 / FP-39264 / Madison 617) TaxID=670483 RepID=S7Q421_GLOTA|nr:DnaJ-domain-containing protein [Gloeophyllum trabeum ATCC 11539]EPQ54218.1 DnaJ-domain-containing protein [Gloeophyllum trabeum ATCC 11539]